MTSKSIKFLDLPQDLSKHVQTKCKAFSIESMKDLCGKSPIELVKLLNVSVYRAEQLLERAFKSYPIKPITGLDLLNMQLKDKKDNVNCNNEIDRRFIQIIDENNLLQKGLLCELCGPPGVGKTQFLFKLCTINQLNASTVFIDSENNFNSKRLIQIANATFADDRELLDVFARNVFVHKILTADDLLRKLDELETDILRFNTTLVIIDSLASLIRRDFMCCPLHERSIYLSKISTKLKLLAELFNVTIVLTNQITTFVGTGNNSNKSNDVNASAIPALGSTWSHFINIRLILQYVNDEYRELLIAKSPSMPFRKYVYRIDSEHGISFERGHHDYKGSNPSFQSIRIKPYKT